MRENALHTFVQNKKSFSMVSQHQSRLLFVTLAILLAAVCASAAPAGSSVPAQSEQSQAPHKVTGNVTDTKGDPLVGAYVVVKGDDKIYAITDLDGNYTIGVPEADAVLVFSFIGFTTAEERVSGRKILNVQLSDQSTEISDAVRHFFSHDALKDIPDGLRGRQILHEFAVGTAFAVPLAEDGIHLLAGAACGGPLGRTFFSRHCSARPR